MACSKFEFQGILVAKVKGRLLDTEIDGLILSSISMVSLSKTLYPHCLSCLMNARRENHREGCLFIAMTSREKIALNDHCIFFIKKIRHFRSIVETAGTHGVRSFLLAKTIYLTQLNYIEFSTVNNIPTREFESRGKTI